MIRAIPHGRVAIALLVIVGAPVKFGDTRFAFKFNAVCVAVLIGSDEAPVLSTIPKPTEDLLKSAIA